MKVKAKNLKIENENQIQVIQLNPKLRLFILIFCNWLALIFLIACIVAIWITPFLAKHFYIFLIVFFGFFILVIFYSFSIIRFGIKYFPKDLREHYLQKNHQQLQKIKNLKVNNVYREFNVIPICNEIYSKKENFISSSWIEETQNRLVVNGKLNELDFSWGIVSKAKKRSFKIFLFSILCFGPILGFFLGLFGSKIVDANPYKQGWVWIDMKYKKLGCFDLFPYHVGKIDSENYLIFSAKLKKSSQLISLVPKNNNQQVVNLDTQYDWPTMISQVQKTAIQNLMKTMKFLPSIYLDHDNLSIVMKKYHYNVQDNQELQTWELLKTPDANSEIQFNYLQQAIKIYQIFNQIEDESTI